MCGNTQTLHDHHDNQIHHVNDQEKSSCQVLSLTSRMCPRKLTAMQVLRLYSGLYPHLLPLCQLRAVQMPTEILVRTNSLTKLSAGLTLFLRKNHRLSSRWNNQNLRQAKNRMRRKQGGFRIRLYPWARCHTTPREGTWRKRECCNFQMLAFEAWAKKVLEISD